MATAWRPPSHRPLQIRLRLSFRRRLCNAFSPSDEHAPASIAWTPIAIAVTLDLIDIVERMKGMQNPVLLLLGHGELGTE